MARQWDEFDEQAERESQAMKGQSKPDRSRKKIQGKPLGKPAKRKVDHKRLRRT